MKLKVLRRIGKTGKLKKKLKENAVKIFFSINSTFFLNLKILQIS